MSDLFIIFPKEDSVLITTSLEEHENSGAAKKGRPLLSQRKARGRTLRLRFGSTRPALKGRTVRHHSSLSRSTFNVSKRHASLSHRLLIWEPLPPWKELREKGFVFLQCSWEKSRWESRHFHPCLARYKASSSSPIRIRMTFRWIRKEIWDRTKMGTECVQRFRFLMQCYQWERGRTNSQSSSLGSHLASDCFWQCFEPALYLDCHWGEIPDKRRRKG